MRRRYASRQAALLRAAERHLDGLLVLRPAEAGMHLVAELAPAVAKRMDDHEAARRAEAAGVAVVPLSASYLQAPRRQGLLLGYGGTSAEEIPDAVDHPEVGSSAQGLSVEPYLSRRRPRDG